jgi:hypothetical protein
MKKPFTKEEQEVMDLIVEAHKKFSALKQSHPDEGNEWRFHLHGLQHALVHRVVSRDYPKDFYSLLNK